MCSHSSSMLLSVKLHSLFSHKHRLMELISPQPLSSLASCISWLKSDAFRQVQNGKCRLSFTNSWVQWPPHYSDIQVATFVFISVSKSQELKNIFLDKNKYLGPNPKKHLRTYIISIILTLMGLHANVSLDLGVHELN